MPQVRRWVYQEEKGVENDYLHAQCYVEFSSAQYFTVIKRYLTEHGHNDAHIEMANGSSEQAYGYCIKDDTRVNGPFKGCNFKHSDDWNMCDHEAMFYNNIAPQYDDNDHLYDFLQECDCNCIDIGRLVDHFSDHDSDALGYSSSEFRE